MKPSHDVDEHRSAVNRSSAGFQLGHLLSIGVYLRLISTAPLTPVMARIDVIGFTFGFN